MVPRCEGKGLLLTGSAHVTCPLPALLSMTQCRGPGSGRPAANTEGLCASWQELGRARRCWVGAGRALGQSRLRSWAGIAASTFLGLPGSGCVCGRRASAWQLLTPPLPTHPGVMVPHYPRATSTAWCPQSWPSLPGHSQARPGRSRAPAQHCPQPGCSLPGAPGRHEIVSLDGQSQCPVLSWDSAWPAPVRYPCPKAPALRWVQPMPSTVAA